MIINFIINMIKLFHQLIHLYSNQFLKFYFLKELMHQCYNQSFHSIYSDRVKKVHFNVGMVSNYYFN